MSIISNSDYCVLCGRPEEHIHHCLLGAYRKKADKFGLTVPLCHSCHEYVHSSQGTETLNMLRKVAQQCYERRYGHESFMKEFGKSWL